jgi:hypothetical protein
MAGLIAPHHHDEDAARAYLEAQLWPDGPVCPHCGIIGEAFKLAGETTRKGLWKCSACRKPFTVTMKTIFEDSHIPLHKWLLAIHLMCSSKKGVSAHQLWRNLWGTDETGKQLGSYRTAWFMAHRIRWALNQEPIARVLSGIVEADETYIGGKIRPGPHTNKPGERPKDRLSQFANKQAVVSVLQRGGDVRSVHVERVTAENLRSIIDASVDKSAHLMTDSSFVMKHAKGGRKHDRVNHKAGEYVRYENGLCITSNTVEGYFSLLKRGVNGIFHHVGKQHLHRYLSEFDFRYNGRKLTDLDRATLAIKATDGKRLTLREPKQQFQGKM